MPKLISFDPKKKLNQEDWVKALVHSEYPDNARVYAHPGLPSNLVPSNAIVYDGMVHTIWRKAVCPILETSDGYLVIYLAWCLGDGNED